MTTRNLAVRLAVIDGGKVKAVLRATGFASGLTASEIAGFADEIERSTLTSAEAVQDAASVLATFRSVAGGDEMVRGTVFDVARGLDWPAPWTLRARCNGFYARWQAAPQEMTCADRRAYAAAAEAGDPEIAALIVGEAADLLREVRPAARILASIADEAARILTDASRHCWPAAGSGRRKRN